MIEVSAPSNIALIKYMGKKSHDFNVASNSSLSITTEHLRTFVQIEKSNTSEDQWRPLDGYNSLQLSEEGKKRYLSFLSKLKEVFSINEALVLSSANNFPSDSGLASSASSFAALTLAVWNYAVKLNPEKALKSLGLSNFNEELKIRQNLAELSKLGSGSSCRSFLSPAVIWQDNQIRAVNLPETIHMVIVVDNKKKKVSSSEAHKAITTSLLNEGRGERAEKRLNLLLEAFEKQDWKDAYNIVWQEFWDMHVLFESASPPFSYMSGESLKVLREIQSLWQEEENGPIVTMDAGPNIHCFFKKEDKALYLKYKKYFGDYYQVIGQE